jgi:prepilin-type N-terminal cleavage/methylation domain-containing protein
MKYLSKNIYRTAYCVLRIACLSVHSEKHRDTHHARRITNNGFTLAEVMTALVILALICSGVLVVINRCAASAADTTLRMQAFEVARENMEKLLTSESVEEGTDFGDSDKYPQIKWQTVVETFYEPITVQMWVRAMCSAEYSDTAGQTQTVELNHWLTSVTDEQMSELMEQQGEEQQRLAEQILETIDEAAQYAQVDVQTIEQWMDDGMLTAEDGSFFKHNLDIYKEANGEPNEEEKNMQISSVEQLLELMEEQSESDGQQQDKIDPATGLPYDEVDKMKVGEIFDLLNERKR